MNGWVPSKFVSRIQRHVSLLSIHSTLHPNTLFLVQTLAEARVRLHLSNTMSTLQKEADGGNANSSQASATSEQVRIVSNYPSALANAALYPDRRLPPDGPPSGALATHLQARGQVRRHHRHHGRARGQILSEALEAGDGQEHEPGQAAAACHRLHVSSATLRVSPGVLPRQRLSWPWPARRRIRKRRMAPPDWERQPEVAAAILL